MYCRAQSSSPIERLLQQSDDVVLEPVSPTSPMSPVAPRARRGFGAKPRPQGLALTAALQLAIKVLTKTCDATTLTPDKFDLATLTLGEGGKVVYHEYTEPESQALLDAAKAEEASADA